MRRKPLSVDHSFAQSPSHSVTRSLGHSPTHVLIPSSLMPFRPACRHTPVQPAFRISQVVFVDAHAHHHNHPPSTPSRNQGCASIKNKEPISYKVPFTPRYIFCLALIRRHHHHYLPLLPFYHLPLPSKLTSRLNQLSRRLRISLRLLVPAIFRGPYSHSRSSALHIFPYNIRCSTRRLRLLPKLIFFPTLAAAAITCNAYLPP
jgi:hypothetical protein